MEKNIKKTEMQKVHMQVDKQVGRNSYEMSSGQKRIFFIDKMQDENITYNFPRMMLVQGVLDLNKLKKALNQVAKRHDVLRTSFISENGALIQRIEKEVHIPMECGTAKKENINRLFKAFIIPFKLDQAPLVRVKLLKTHTNEMVLMLDMHHIITDDISTDIFFRDLAKFYNGEIPDDLKLQYKDYSVWQNKQDFSAQKKYWLEEFSGEIPIIDLNTDLTRPEIKSYQGSHITTTINQVLKNKIKKFCHKNSVPEDVFLLSLFMLLLNCYSRQNEIIVGSPIWGRLHPETEDIMGMFANYLAIKGIITDNQKFVTFLNEIKIKYDKAVENQEYPFDELVENLKLVRDPSRNPLFDVMFVLENHNRVEYKLGRASLTPMYYENQTAKLDLMLIANDVGRKYVLDWEYNTDLFREKTIERMGAHFEQLLASALEEPNREIGELSFLTAKEKERVLFEFNQTQTEYPKDKTIIELFEKQAERVPDNIAVEIEGQILTYKELNERANFIGEELRRHGAQPDTIVGIVAGKSLEMIIGLYGILKSGAAYMPIDPEYPIDRIKYMYENSGAKLLVAGPGSENAVNELKGMKIIDLVNSKGKKENNLEHLSKPNHLAYVIYTSGSTGKPKGVMVENKGVVNVCSWYQQQGLVQESSIVMQNYNFVFDASISEIFPTGLIGAKLLLLTELQKNDPGELLTLLPGKQLSLIPSMFRMMLEYAEMHNKKSGLEKFDKIYLGAEALPFDLLEKYKRLTGNDLEGLYNVYGPTEVTDTVVTYKLKDLTNKEIVPIGKPLSNLRAFILNGTKLCGIGMPGELCIAGDGVSRGYLNNPELTRQNFIENPYQKGEIIYRTGDLARWMDDGNIQYLGRIDAQVKIRGFRIELGEIESRLREIEAIRDAAVVALEENGIKYLSAYVVSNETIEGNKIKEQLNGMLPGYMIPSYITQLKTFPLNHNGKLDRKALPMPVVVVGQEYEKPRNEIQEAVVEVFKEILGGERIGIKDNFFDLGGDSIKAIRIVSKLREKGYHANVKSIMNGKTAEYVSRDLTKLELNHSDNSEVIGEVLLTPIQREFFCSKLNVPEHYNQSYALESTEKIEVDKLEASLRAVASHHDMLRAVYDGENQTILPIRESGLFELKSYDYTDIENQDEVYQLLDNDSDAIQSSISLKEGPLLKVGLFHTKDRDYVMLCIHHLVVDGVSWRIIVEDLVKGYQAARAGRNIVLPAKTVSFQKWSQALCKYRNSYLLKREIPYWMAVEEQVLDSKLNEPAAESRASFALLKIGLDEETTSNLLQKSRKAYNTEINDLLLTALFRALYLTSGKDTVAVLMEGHGREPLDQPLAIDRTVGWFTSTYPVALKGIGKTLKEDIRKTKEMLRRVPNHGLGYSVLNYLGTKVLQGVNPEITFNYLGEFGQEDGENNFKISQFAHGRDVSEQNIFESNIVMKGAVVNKRFEMSIAYNQSKYSSEFMETMQSNFENQLVEVIKHCIETKSCYTASDLGELNWSDQEFLRVDEEFKEKGYEIERIYPLTGLQEGMLFHKMEDESAASYVVQSIYKLVGEVNEQVLQDSLELLAEKHEILRTSIVYKNVREPRQVLLRGRKTEYCSIDLSNQINAIDQFRTIKENEVKRGFDLESDSLFRVIMVKLSSVESYLILSSHHIIEDGWSTSIIIDDFLSFYDDLYSGQNRQEILKNIIKDVRYEDYVRLIGNRNIIDGYQYWRELLDGYGENIGIMPEGKTDSSDHEVESVMVSLNTEESRKLQKISKQYDVTINTILEASWAVLLKKYNNVDDVVFGKVVSGRNAELKGIENLVGLFINTIPVRAVMEKQSFKELLQSLQQQAIKNSLYDYCPLNEIQKQSSLGGDLFDTLVVSENYYVKANHAENNLKLNLVDIREQTNYPLTLISYVNDTLDIGLMYKTSKYGKVEAERILNRLKTILQHVAENSEIQIDKIELLTSQEQELIVNEFNNNKTAYSREKNIIELFEEQVERVPDEIALVCEGEELTYAQLNCKANQLGQRLRTMGVKPDDFVGIFAERKISMIVSTLGILKSGGAYLPIDPKYPIERIQYILKDSKCKVLFTEGNAEKLSGDSLPEVIDLSNQKIYGNQTQDNLKKVNTSRDLAYLIYTSGTTGAPKGVMVEQRSVNRLVKNTNYMDFSNLRVLQTGALTFDASTFEVWGALLNGGRLYVVNEEVLTRPELLKDAILSNKINTMWLTVTLYNQMISMDPTMFDKLSYLFIGGEQVSETHVRLLKDRNKKIHLINGYGPTESTTFTTTYEIGHQKTNVIPIGKPIANTSVYILNGDMLCGIGMPGELCIGGEGLSRGYINAPELTAKKFDNFYLTGERIYRSGDLARWMEDGNIQFLGRVDEQVKIRGFRIELGEIESQLREIEMIEDAAVIVIEEEGSKYLCGYVVPKGDIGIDQIKQKLSKTLPDYMIPNYIMKLSDLPTTKHGKLDKRALPKPDLSVLLATATEKYVEPRNETEACIVKVFKEILGAVRVGIDDNFFDLGGDSIKAIRIISKLREEGYEVRVKSIMQEKTARRISETVQNIETSALDDKEVTGSVDLTPIQKEFFNSHLKVPNHFNQSFIFECQEQIDDNSLGQVLEAIVKHHDMLRAVYDGKGQRILSIKESRLFELTSYNYTDVDNQDELNRLIDKNSDELQAGMNLAEGPLLKAGVFHTIRGDYLMLCIHHLVIDGISWRIIMEDLTRGYAAAKDGKKIVLPTKTTSFQKWSQALGEFRESYTLEREIPYWQDVEAHVADSQLNDSKAATGSGFAELMIELDEKRTSNLVQETGRAYHTEINDLLLTALFRAVHQVSGKETVSVMMEGHGREPLEQPLAIDRTIGWFTSKYPVVFRGSGGTLREDIRKTKELLRRIPNHGIGYGVLKHLGSAVLKDVNPEITFNYLGEFGQEKAEDTFKINPIAHGHEVSEENEFGSDITIDGVVVNKKLELSIVYNQAKYTSEFMEQIRECFEQQIFAVINHCMDSETTYTASDFGELSWSDKEFTKVEEKFRARGHEIERIYPLTSLQEGMLFHKLEDEETTSYVVQSVYKLESELEEEKLLLSLELLKEKHEILRSNIVYKNVGEPRQVLVSGKEIEYHFIDLSKQTNPYEKYQQIKEMDVKRGFDLENDSLLRVMVLRIDKETQYIIINIHHIIIDGWSNSIMMNDLLEFYDELCIGKTKKEISDNMQKGLRYEEYVRFIQNKNKKPGHKFWKELLDGYEEKVGIRPEGNVDVTQEQAGTAVIRLSLEESKKLESVSKKYEVTINTMMEAAWGVLLQKYNNTKDVVFGKVVSGRNAHLPGIEDLVGLFINTIPVRAKAELKQFSEFLIEMQQQAVKGNSYDDCPLTEIQNESLLGRNLFETLLVFENYYVQDKNTENKLKLAILIMREQTNYPLTLFSSVEDGALEIGLMYETSKYGKIEAERIINRLRLILLNVIENPEINIDDIELLTVSEKELIVKNFNNTKTDYPRDKTIIELFEEQVERVPDEIAVVGNGEELTYAQLNCKANRLGELLRASGVKPDDFVGIIAERKVSTIAGILGILKSGGAYLTIDPKTPDERLNYILKDSGCKVLLTDENTDKFSGSILTQILNLSDIERFARKTVDNLDKVNTATDLAYLIYTSGTTGEPKGVIIEQRSVNRLVKNTNYLDFTNVKILQTGSLTFDASTFEIWGALLNGGRLYIVGEEVLMDIHLLEKTLKQYPINTMFLTTALYNQLISMNEGIFDSLSQLLFGGEATSEEHVRILRERNNQLKLSNVYGPTESTTFATYYPITGERLIGKIPIGRPIANTTTYIFNGKMLSGIGMPGELCIGGDGLSRGYLNSKQLTDDKYFENPYKIGERLYRTGDLARWGQDGNIEFLGRIDDQVKIRGFRIEPSEVASRLRGIEMIEDAAVVVREQGSSKYLCGYVVSKRDINTDQIKQKLREMLPEYMVPNYIIKLPELPLNKNGKLDKKALPVPEIILEDNYVEARNETESCIVKVFKEILGVNQVGIDDNFFELGGDSIKGIRILSKLRDEGYELNIKSIMQEKTARRISEKIKKIETFDTNNSEVIGHVSLTPIQMEFFNYNLKVPNHFNQSFIFKSKERIDEDCLKLALEAVVIHHDMLRAVYQGVEQEIRPISESKLYELKFYDYCNIEDYQDVYRLIDERSNQIQSSISLSDGPLLKAGLSRLKQNDFVMICIHHLVVDGVSWRILVEDLTNSYRSAKEERSIVLPAKTTSFPKWSQALGEFRNSHMLEREIPYWIEVEKQVLESRLNDLETADGSGFADLMIKLDEERTASLLQKSGKAYHTEINDLLLTALFRSIRQVSGQETVAVLMEGHGREALDHSLAIDRTVGWFTTTYPVTYKSSDVMLMEDIRNIKELLRRIPNHGLGYSVLRHLGSTVLKGVTPEITFNYLGEFGQEEGEKLFQIDHIAHGLDVAEENVFGGDIVMNGAVVNREFQMTITYNRARYSSEFIEQLRTCFEEELLLVISHCTESESSYTASDFGELSWSDKEFTKVEEKLRTKGYQIERLYPLTNLQEGMLFHKLEDGETTSYVVQSVYKVEDEVNEEILCSSLQLLGEKHEILRTNLIYKMVREPRQVLLSGKEIEYHSIDLSNETDPYQKYLELKEKDVKRGFDLEDDSLLRIMMLKIDEKTRYMIMNIHHIIIDGWSRSIMMNDLLSFYNELYNGKTKEELFEKIEKGVKYEEYVHFIQNQNKKQGLRYWNELLEGYEGKIGIRPEGNPDVNEQQVGIAEVSLSTEESRKLETISKKYEVTINTLIEAVWGILLQKYNNTNDVVFGKVVSGRNAKLTGIEKIVGLFVNTIPVRAVAKQELFSEFLIGMQQQAVKGNPYDNCTLSEIQNECRSGRGLFDTLMVFENYYVQNESAENKLKLNLVDSREQTNYPLTLFSYIQNTLDIGLMYDTSIYGKSEAERIVNRLKTILLNVIKNPEVRIDEIELLTVQERTELLITFNNTHTKYPEEKTIMELFEEQVKKTPNGIAIAAQNEEMTYAELNKRANQVGQRLRQSGISPDDFVGILAERKISTIVGIVGILKSGGAYLPLDPQYPAERINYIIKDSKCKVVLAENTNHQYGADDAVEVINLQEPGLFAEQVMDNLEKTNRSSRDLAYLIYTSGTTGEPKGVMIEQRSVNRLVKNTNYLDFTDVRILQTGSLTFDASTFEIWGALLNGGKLSIVDEEVLLDIHLLEESMKQYNANTMFITTALYNQLISMNERIFDSLSQLLFGGEATSEEHVRRLWERNKQIKLSNIYGPTESTTFAIYYPITGEQLRAKTPIGKPIANTTAYIFNGKKMSGIGMQGELCIGGDGLSRGYLNSEQLTNDKYFENPYRVGERLYRTGDLARWTQDGNINFMGRIDDQVKIRGFRIEPGEIESRLRAIEMIEDAAVVVREESGSKYLCGYVVSKEKISDSRIKQKLSENLPDYMIPSYIIDLPNLPLNKNGKLDKYALPEPDFAAATVENYVVPRNEIETCIAKVFEEILGINLVGIDDSFFELGGDSIKAIRIVSRLREEGYKITVKSIMKEKTVRKIGEVIQNLTVQSKDLAEVTGIVKSTPIQIEYLGNKLLVPEHFNQSFVLESQEHIDSKILGMVLKEIAIHHDILRAVYEGTTQKILSSKESKLYELFEVDYTGIDSRDEWCKLIHKKSDEIQRSMNLSAGPLFKAGLFHTADKDYIMLCAHHFVIDGISWRIIIEDLVKGYKAIKAGGRVVFPSKTTSFQAWSEALSMYRETYHLKKEIPYWKDIEQKVRAAELTVTVAGEGFSFAEKKVALSEQYTNDLLLLAGKTYHTEINDLLLAALFRAINKVSGQETVAVLMEGHGREPLDTLLAIDRTVGWFTSTYPVAVEGIGKTFKQDIRAVKESLRRIPNHGLGYGVLKELGEKVLIGIVPQVVFNYLGEFDQEDTTEGFKISNISHGADSSEKNLLDLEIAVNGVVVNKELLMSITYNQIKYSDEFMGQIQSNFEVELKEIIDHCLEGPEDHTASDLGELSWSDEEFIELNEKFRKRGYEIERIYPLTGLQEGMLFHKLQDEEESSYVVQNVYWIENQFDEQLLRESLQLLGEKHEVLRTSIVYDGVSIPRQVLLKGRDIEYRLVDFSNEKDSAGKARKIIAQDVRRGFNLEQDSLLRITIVREDWDTHYFIMSFHHIILDGWCMSVLMNDLLSFYNELYLGKKFAEIQSSIQKGVRYEDYVRYLQNNDKESALNYWKELLHGYNDNFGILPAGRPDATNDKVRTIKTRLAQEDSRKLEEVSKKYEVTVNTIVEASWGILLQKYNNSDDVVFGKVVSGRNAEINGIEKVVGLFINTVPVRVQSDDRSFSEMLVDLQQQALSGNLYDDCPLSEIQANCGSGRELFETLLVFENYYSQEGQGDNHLNLFFKESREQTNYPLTLYSYLENGLELGLMYDTSLYGKNEAERILNRLKAVLLNAAENPEMEIGG